jgi:hypothetical protein
MIKIRDLSDKGRKQNKRLRYEVATCHVENDATPTVVAKFQSYGSAMLFAIQVAEGNCYYAEILIRS